MAGHNSSALYSAFNAALADSSGNTQRDPIKNVFHSGETEFNHENIFGFLDVNGFDQSNINFTNIENAATLYALMVIGDQLGVYRAADTVLKYVTMGKVDVASNSTATRLYNYMKLRDQRTTPEERGIFYKQVFNWGNDQTTQGFSRSHSGGQELSSNTVFPPRWESLLTESIRFLEKTERADNPEIVSVSGIRQAIINLQHNLSRAASGMVKLFIPEMYAHLEDAIQILDADEIKNQLGSGVARDLWTVVETINMEEYHSSPDTAALRTVAATGRNIILYIANYNEVNFQNTVRTLIDNVDAHIIASSSIDGSSRGDGSGGRMSDFERMEEEVNAIEDEWA